MAAMEEAQLSKFQAIQQMLNQILEQQQDAIHRKPSHGSNSSNSLFQNNLQMQYTQEKNQQTIVAITDLQCYNGEEAKNQKQHSTMEESQFQQLPFQSPESEAAKQITTNLKFNTDQEMAIGAEMENSETPSPEPETSPFWHSRDRKGVTTTKVGVEDDASLTGKAEAADVPDSVAETISGGDLQSIGAVEEAKLDLSGNYGVEFDAAVTVKEVANNAGSTRPCRRSLFVAKPPALVAANFPWNRERESQTKKTNGRAEASDVPVLLIVEDVVAPMNLLVEEKEEVMVGLEGDVTSFVSPWIPVRETNQWKVRDDGAVREDGTVRVGTEESQGVGSPLMGLAPFRRRKEKSEQIFCINGYRIVWDPGGSRIEKKIN